MSRRALVRRGQCPPSTGMMKWLRGSEEGDVVVRGGWAMAFQRPGMSDFTGVFGDNQGIQATLQADQTTNTLPILLRNNPTLPAAPTVSLPAAPASITTRGNAFDQNIQMPYTQSWSAGWQRKITNDSAIEFRYVGSKHANDWDSININEPNITTNGFLNEFRQAQANLQANIAAGRGATFAYMGAGTGTNPLPIFLAHFNAANAANAGNAAVYSGAQWTNATNLGFLAARNPNPWGFAIGRRQRLDRQCRVPQQRGGRRPAGELLRRQSGPARRRHDRRRVEPDGQWRRHARALDAVRVPQALLARLLRQPELHLEPGGSSEPLWLRKADGVGRTGRPGR